MNSCSERVANLLGFITKAQAKSEGYSHHASYYGIPLWMGDIESDGPIVCVKWRPLDCVMDLFMYIEAFLFPLVHGADTEPMFMFKIHGELK